jgi:hypothetical protein
MKENFKENQYLKCWIENGILYGVYTTDYIDLEIAKICAGLRIDVCNGNYYPALADVRSVKSATKDAREYLASEHGTSFIVATAMIISSSVNKILGNFYLQINKPKIPAKIFTNKKDAIKWLSQYV